jgi:hypothetical protein
VEVTRVKGHHPISGIAGLVQIRSGHAGLRRLVKVEGGSGEVRDPNPCGDCDNGRCGKKEQWGHPHQRNITRLMDENNRDSTPGRTLADFATIRKELEKSTMVESNALPTSERATVDPIQAPQQGRLAAFRQTSGDVLHSPAPTPALSAHGSGA